MWWIFGSHADSKDAIPPPPLDPPSPDATPPGAPPLTSHGMPTQEETAKERTSDLPKETRSQLLERMAKMEEHMKEQDAILANTVADLRVLRKILEDRQHQRKSIDLPETSGSASSKPAKE